MSEGKKRTGEEEKVEGLLERISEGMLPADRRESMEELKALLECSEVAVEAFSEMGVPVMCSVLRDDVHNLGLVQVRFNSLIHTKLQSIKHT
jgi:hypothetical protein